MRTETVKETLPVTAAEIARRRLKAYLDEKLRDEYDSEAWEFYTSLLETAKRQKVSRNGYLSETYLEDQSTAVKNRGPVK
jgi:hypothetical protein